MDISERIEILLAKAPDDLTEDEVKFLEEEAMKNYMFEQSIKLLINSIYGAFANNFFHFYNVDIAETVTTQGQDAIKYTEKATNHYVKKLFHTDKETLKQLGSNEPIEPISNNAAIYIDTDSIFFDSLIKTNRGEYTIGEIFKLYSKLDGVDIDERGNELIFNPDFSVLNLVNGKVQYSKVATLIRHRVRKKKWRIITESGKEVIITGDHSIMVVRNNELIAIKAADIYIDTDKIVSICGKKNTKKLRR